MHLCTGCLFCLLSLTNSTKHISYGVTHVTCNESQGLWTAPYSCLEKPDNKNIQGEGKRILLQICTMDLYIQPALRISNIL